MASQFLTEAKRGKSQLQTILFLQPYVPLTHFTSQSKAKHTVDGYTLAFPVVESIRILI